MVSASFRRENGRFQAVSVTGHAGFAPHGEDIVCASVTSAVQMAANGITEILGVPAQLDVEENLVAIELPPFPQPCAWDFLQALHLHLCLLEEQYREHIQVTVTEV